MGEFLRDYGLSALLAAGLHALLFAMLFVGLSSHQPIAGGVMQEVEVIEARVVDERLLELQAQRIAEAEAERERQRRQAIEEAERLRREAAAEQARVERLQRDREQAERERVQQLAREAEQARQREEAERREREAAERRAREAEEARQQAEAERRQREEAERLAREQAERRAREEARRQAEREAELRRMMEGEERRRQAEQAGLLAQYIREIEQRIVRNWIRPPTARAGLNCEVHVRQAPGGQVLDVRIGTCNGDDAVRRSIESAVYRASPLPEPRDPSLFERNLRVIFRPES